MATKKKSATTPIAPERPADTTDPAPKVTNPSSKPKYADDDNSIDARMWRLNQDHIAMGSRTPE